LSAAMDRRGSARHRVSTRGERGLKRFRPAGQAGSSETPRLKSVTAGRSDFYIKRLLLSFSKKLQTSSWTMNRSSAPKSEALHSRTVRKDGGICASICCIESSNDLGPFRFDFGLVDWVGVDGRASQAGSSGAGTLIRRAAVHHNYCNAAGSEGRSGNSLW